MNDNDIGAAMARMFQDGGDGQKIFEHLTSYFYDTPCYTKGDPYDSIFRLGQREVILYIIAKMNFATQPYVGDDNDN